MNGYFDGNTKYERKNNNNSYNLGCGRWFKYDTVGIKLMQNFMAGVCSSSSHVVVVAAKIS